MVGTSLIFYKIPITRALITAVITAQYPAQPTIVQRFVPPVANPIHYARDGMRPLDNRLIVFECLEAMRALMVSPVSVRSTIHFSLLLFSVIVGKSKIRNSKFSTLDPVIVYARRYESTCM